MTIEQVVTVVVGVSLGSLIGTWLGSKLMARNLADAIQKAAQSDALITVLNRRAEEIGASFVRGARTELKDRFNFVRIPHSENPPENGEN